MSDLYLFLVVLLLGLAIFDLVVGVSNDAVNFLNSAIGSRVAPRKIIMVVASVGIFIGAASSDGMMEVARKGIFHPEAFSFADVMVLFTAVMLTDIILLDLFNTFGLPTSTTVSIVFELLGAAVAVSLIKMSQLDQGLGHMGEYINWANAGKIVFGILLSVLVAFTIGALTMYLSRLLFTFRYEKRLKWVGAAWGSLALTALTWFLLTKGLKHAAFLENSSDWIKANIFIVIGISFAFWAVVLQIVAQFTRFNILRIVVLFGTFSLAMAFAGNDLVNFIGVPVAGFTAYGQWVDSGQTAEAFNMAILAEKIPTPWYLLFGAGLIMVLTLWLSRKARSVTETEVKLGRQNEGSERFSPNALSRGIVRFSQAVGDGFRMLSPRGAATRSRRTFEKVELTPVVEGGEVPDFDLVRASVNLAVASMIISYASAQKLPLSTTYVSFMVAMGASLADRAWGRESAVFRVAGVFSVIAGWFGTAAAAFTAAATFASVIYFFGIYGIVGLVLLAGGLVLRTSIVHRRRESKKAAQQQGESTNTELDHAAVQDQSAALVAETLQTLQGIFREGIAGLLREDLAATRAARKQMTALEERNENIRYALYHYIRRIQGKGPAAGRHYLKIISLEQDVVQSAGLIVNSAATHVENVHLPPSEKQTQGFEKLLPEVQAYLQAGENLLENEPISKGQRQEYRARRDALVSYLDALLDNQVEGVREATYGARNSLLFFSIVLEFRDLVNTVEDLITEFTELKL
ncbi:MAG: inorganic phosphate transporter [Bacteroidota bacterium]